MKWALRSKNRTEGEDSMRKKMQKPSLLWPPGTAPYRQRGGPTTWSFRSLEFSYTLRAMKGFGINVSKPVKL